MTASVLVFGSCREVEKLFKTNKRQRDLSRLTLSLFIHYKSHPDHSLTAAATATTNSNSKESGSPVKTMSEIPVSEIPEEVAAAKALLEKETGKKYMYRRPKKDMPSISHMLAHGAPGTEGKPATWSQIIGYPLVLAILFGISLLIFHHAPHSTSKGKGHFVLNARKKAKLPHRPVERMETAGEGKPLRYPDVDLHDLAPPGEKEVKPLAPLDVVQDKEEVQPLEPEL